MSIHRETYLDPVETFRDVHGYIALALKAFIALCSIAAGFGLGFWIGRITA